MSKYIITLHKLLIPQTQQGIHSSRKYSPVSQMCTWCNPFLMSIALIIELTSKTTLFQVILSQTMISRSSNQVVALYVHAKYLGYLIWLLQKLITPRPWPGLKTFSVKGPCFQFYITEFLILYDSIFLWNLKFVNLYFEI